MRPRDTPGRTAKGTLAIALSVTLALALLGWATDGFAVLTTDAARARAVREAPRPVPEVLVRDITGATQLVLDDAHVAPDANAMRVTSDTSATSATTASAPHPRAVIVDFIYTRCITLCSVLGGTFQRLQRDIAERGLQDRVRLLTLSFDLEFDDPEHLAMHARVMGANPVIWSLAIPVHAVDRDQLLATFGVQVIPDGRGGWVHNGALHIVSPEGRLVRIVDIDQPALAIAAALQSWEAGAP